MKILEEDMEDQDWFELALRNNIAHSIGDEVYKECGKSLTFWHMLFIQGALDLQGLRNGLYIESVRARNPNR